MLVVFMIAASSVHIIHVVPSCVILCMLSLGCLNTIATLTNTSAVPRPSLLRAIIPRMTFDGGRRLDAVGGASCQTGTRARELDISHSTVVLCI